MAKISVIIPTHNRAELLRTAIISVLNQTFQDFEIIVVDDASTDNTPEAVTRFDDKRIKYMRNNTNKGDAGTRNIGVTNSNCTYIAFLDDDDEWLQKKLEIQMDILENSSKDIGGVYTNRIELERVSGKILRAGMSKGRKDLLRSNCITTSSLLLRKECFERVGLFDEGIPFCSDYDMWIRISEEFQFEYIDEPLVKYSIHGNRLSVDYDKVIRGTEILLKKHSEIPWLNSKYYAYMYFYLGVLYCYKGNIKKGRQAYLQSISIYPYEPRTYFNFCLSLAGEKNFKKLRKTKEKIVDFLKERWI